MRTRSLALVITFVLLVALLAAVPGVASAAPVGWWIKCVMPATGDVVFDAPVKASAKLVAAIATTGDGQQVWVWESGASAPRVLMATWGITNNDFAVDGSRVVWLYGAQVMTWKIGDAKPTTVTVGNNTRGELALSGDRIAWHDSTIQRICTWKVGDSGVTTLSALPYGGMQTNPSVSGDRIVFEQSNGNWQIITWKAGQGDPVAVEADDITQIEPVVSGDRVSWVRYYGNYDAFVRTKVIGGSAATTVGPVAWGPYVFISGDRLAWRQWSGDPAGGSGVTHLVTWASGDTTPTRVTHEGEYVYGNGQDTPVSGDRVAWLNWRVVQGVMTWASGDTTPTVLAMGMGLGYPALGGNTVAWLDSRVGTKGIYVAHPQAAPKLTTPSASPTKPKHGKYFAIKGGIGSADPVGARVSLRVERYYSRKWHLVTTYTATLSAAKRTYSYTKAKVGKAGKYRVRASHVADFTHLAGTSSWKTFSVK